MRLLYLLCAFLLSFDSAASKPQQLLHQSLLTFTDALYATHQSFQQQLEQTNSQLIDNINYNYIEMVGAVVQINYSKPLALWLKEHSDQASHHQAATPELSTKNNFDQLRAQAKQLSHQIYSLERQLSWLKKQAQQDNNNQIQRHEINVKLDDLRQQKQTLKPQYDQAKLKAEQQQETFNKPASNSHYLTLIRQQLYQQSCQNQELMQYFDKRPQESLSLILKAAGELSDYGYQDLVFRLPNKLISACHQQAITEQAFLTGLQSQRF